MKPFFTAEDFNTFGNTSRLVARDIANAKLEREGIPIWCKCSDDPANWYIHQGMRPLGWDNDHQSIMLPPWPIEQEEKVECDHLFVNLPLYRSDFRIIDYMKENYKFCPKCGTKLNGATDE